MPGQRQLGAGPDGEVGQALDRVHPELGGAAVRGPTVRDDPQPERAAVSQVRPVARRLGDHHRPGECAHRVPRRAPHPGSRSPRRWSAAARPVSPGGRPRPARPPTRPPPPSSPRPPPVHQTVGDLPPNRSTLQPADAPTGTVSTWQANSSGRRGRPRTRRPGRRPAPRGARCRSLRPGRPGHPRRCAAGSVSRAAAGARKQVEPPRSVHRRGVQGRGVGGHRRHAAGDRRTHAVAPA